MSPYTTADLYESICLYELGRFEDARAVLETLTVGRRGELGVPWAGLGPDATLALCLVELDEVGAARRVLCDGDATEFPFAAGAWQTRRTDEDHADERPEGSRAKAFGERLAPGWATVRDGEV